MMNAQRVIILFVKYPEKGRVKTRLARTLGDEAAVSIYRQLVARLVRMLRGVNVEEIRVCFDPPDKQREIDSWIRSIWLEAGEELNPDVSSGEKSELVFWPQCEGNLGDRLKSAFSSVFRENEEAGIDSLKVFAIGSDCIEIDEQTFLAASQALENEDAVFGPTFDGGYYLVGMKEYYPDLFENIPWSTDETLEVSLNRACESGLKTSVLEKRHDIDTEEDWHRAAAKYSLKAFSKQDDEISGEK